MFRGLTFRGSVQLGWSHGEVRVQLASQRPVTYLTPPPPPEQFFSGLRTHIRTGDLPAGIHDDLSIGGRLRQVHLFYRACRSRGREVANLYSLHDSQRPGMAALQRPVAYAYGHCAPAPCNRNSVLLCRAPRREQHLTTMRPGRTVTNTPSLHHIIPRFPRKLSPYMR